MRIPNPRRIDPTWLIAAAVGVLALAAIVTMLVLRWSQPTPNLATPSGVVTAYVQAVQAGDGDRAWNLLSPDAASGGPGKFGPVYTQTDFRQQVEGSRRSTASRVRILDETQSGDNGTVRVEVTNTSDDLLSGSSSQIIIVSLKREAAGWRITSNPYPWQFQ